MKRIIFLLFLFVIFKVSVASAQVRVLAGADLNSGTVAGQELKWQGLEVEVEKSFKNNHLFLSGFSIGARKEALNWQEGLYLTFRTFRREDIGGFQIIPSLTILWGMPGTTLNRGNQERYEEFVSYARVFPLRNSQIPGLGVPNAGLIYPELSVAIRKTFLKDIFSIEPVLGVRVIRFGVVESDGRMSRYNERTGFLPSFGLRVGIKPF